MDQILDPTHNLGFVLEHVESLYVDAHEPSLGSIRVKLSLQDASRIKSLPKHPMQDAVSDNKYITLFDARPNAFSTFGIRIKQFLTTSNIVFSDILETEREREREREREMFYLTTHSTHFIYGYMASDIWLRTILIVRKETRCRHIGYSYRLTARVLLYAPSLQDNTYHGLCYTSRGALAGTRTFWKHLHYYHHGVSNHPRLC